MITLWKSFLQAFLYDEMAVKRWVRGGLNAAAVVLGQVIIDPTWNMWTPKQWLIHLVPSVLAFAAGSVTAGEKNPKS
jgi:hypothetical protein